MPDDLAAALADDETSRAAFDRLSYSHQREYAQWITGAKRAETRSRRVTQALARLKEGKTAR